MVHLLAMSAPDPHELCSAIPAAIVGVCRRLREAGHEAWVVGGAVRDLILGRPAQDFDVATAARPEQVAQVFGRRRTIPTGERHGTVTVLIGDGEERHQVEVTTFRGEGAYTDGRRPDSVEFVRDLVQDLERRDFTINALALDPLGAPGQQLADPFGGLVDLAARTLRAVGDPRARFREDGLRVMRAVRFAAQLEFTLDPATEAAIPQALDVFKKVSQERVRDELLKLLGAPRPSIGLRLMERTGLLGEVLPELCEAVGLHQNRYHSYDVWEHTVVAVDETPGAEDSRALVRLGTLLHDVGKPRTAAPKEGSPDENTFFGHDAVGAEMADAICRRLKLPNRDRERVVALVRHHMFWYSAEWTDATVRRFIGRVGLDVIPDLFALRTGDVRARGRGESPGVEIDELKARIEREVEAERALKVTDLAVDGKDVMRVLGCPPGRIVGDVLRQLLERVIEDPALNDRERLTALIPEVAREFAPGPGAAG
ncbi:MAG TPA: HD domain-containing protein [Polyangia bacterium]|nr:HD domain-containing protein [Polyangia bacterium]